MENVITNQEIIIINDIITEIGNLVIIENS